MPEGHTFEERERRAVQVVTAAAMFLAASRTLEHSQANRIALLKASDRVRQAVEAFEALFD